MRRLATYRIAGKNITRNAPPGSASSRWVSTGLVTLSAAGLASLNILAKIAYIIGINVVTMLSVRFLIATLVLAFIIKLQKKPRRTLPVKHAGALFVLGAIVFAGQAALLFMGLQRLTASLAVIVLFMYPIWVAIIGWASKHIRPHWSEMVAAVLSIGGITFSVISGYNHEYTIDLIGVLMVLGSSICYATYIVLSEKLIHQAGALRSVAWIMGGASFSFLIAGFAGGSLDLQMGLKAAPVLIAMAIVSTIMPHVTLLAGVARIGSTAASLLSTLEPVFTVIFALILLAEPFIWQQAIGGLLVLGSVVLITLERPANAECRLSPASCDTFHK